MTATSTQHIRGVYISRFIYYVGYYLLMPILAILLQRAPYAYSLSEVALAVAVYGFSERGLSIVVTPWVERIGYQRSQVIGYIMGAIGLFIVAWSTAFFGVVGALAFAGIGFSITGVASRGYVNRLPVEFRMSGFTAMYIGINAGTAIGTAVAFYLPYEYAPRWVVLGTAACIVIAAGMAKWMLERTPGVASGITWRECFRNIWDDGDSYGVRRGFGLIGISCIAVFLFLQIFELVPLYFEQTLVLPSYVGIVLSLNALIIVLGQQRVRILFTILHSRWRDSGLLFGLICMTLGMMCFAVYWNVYTLLPALLCVTLGEMFIFPYIDYLISTDTHETLHAYLQSINHTMAAVARAGAAYGGIHYLGGVVQYGWPVVGWWWIMSTIGGLAILVMCVMRWRRDVCGGIKTQH
ncbi:MAG: hypothetical protein COX62_06050 [Deltaproteobacteria bacterium CG_4_10_14_0_2_um_filter_43_8]|nr:MAG: hypothetical protein COV43_07240 [Deltaproteobacteria bacterium CG11_big_fil_rev_8_21_14_0_20_42_23]PJA19763.1 MAG: hypothetical protein COX62_06050 [Deltaproteobacteria bacterium CG_4_10_14_0_2_um_filter_43_8]PJC64190.1 MAG: hypothetical protein CO021_05605 [Deltaproteobacteria bacterium CG_4_9_14_0_2_um_filter_42_21]